MLFVKFLLMSNKIFENIYYIVSMCKIRAKMLNRIYEFLFHFVEQYQSYHQQHYCNTY